MKIRTLKKQLLKEEKKRSRNNLLRKRLLVTGLALVLIFVVLAVVYLANQDRILAYRLATSEELLEEGAFDDAVELLYDLQRKHPEFSQAPMALFRAGEVQELYLKNDQEALLTYLLVIRDYPQTPWALQAQLRAAGIYKYRLRDFNQALTLLQKIVDSGAPDADRVQYEVADTYFRLNNFEQARIEFESLLRNFPQSPLVPEAQYRIAVTNSLEGNLEGAAQGYRKVFENWPESRFALEARFRFAAVLEEQEHLRQALSNLVELRGKYPNAAALEERIRKVEERLKKKKTAL